MTWVREASGSRGWFRMFVPSQYDAYVYRNCDGRYVAQCRGKLRIYRWAWLARLACDWWL